MFTKDQLHRKLMSQMDGFVEHAFNIILNDVRLCPRKVVEDFLYNLSFAVAHERLIGWDKALEALHQAVQEGRPVGEFLGTFAVAFPKLPPITEEEAAGIEGYGSM